MSDKYNRYYIEYKRTKSKYLKLKGSGYDYMHKLVVRPVDKYQVNFFNKYFSKLDTLDVVEFGIGNAARSIWLAKLFKSYTGVEPNGKLLEYAKENCKKHSCQIRFVKATAEEFDEGVKYDLAIFINTFHFVDPIKTFKMLNSIIKQGGVVYIDEPKGIPEGWGSPKLNKGSPEFDPQVWQRKKGVLDATKKFLLESVKDYGFVVDHYELPKRDVFFLKK